MRDKKRIKRILKRLEELWNQYPDLRFGQFLINIGMMEDTYPYWKIEDDKTEEHLKKFKW